jgi:hypothetical protein
VKIIAVSTVRNEEAIIGKTLDHLFAQGITQVLLSDDSDDDTRSVYGTYGPEVRWLYCEDPFDQSNEVTRLAHHARDMGADWIIPFDADEFWKSTEPGTVRRTLEGVNPNITTIYAPMFLHVTWEERAIIQKPLGKCCFRPHTDMQVMWGSHHISNPGEAIHGILQIRELQYQSWDHFLQKIERSRELHSKPSTPKDVGTHMQRLIGMDETALRAWWNEHLATPTVVDPIS